MKRTAVSFQIESVPLVMQPYLEGASFYDSSCSEDAKTYFIEKMDSNHTFLKINRRGVLEREAAMTSFIHDHQLAPKVIAYHSDEQHDYLLTEAINGDDGTEPLHLNDPHRLATVFGHYLRKLHSLPTDGCPYSNKTEDFLSIARSKDKDLSVLDPIKYIPSNDTLTHGDYCLPNIIMKDFELQSFIDLGDGGIGDRHHDLYWGLWTLHYNLKTDQYDDLFLDAYGRDQIHENGIAYFAKLMELMAW
ncbi:aminoglycoside 3'-phosphotransferase [Paenibacillus sp. OV219]|uniref:aminoglycoside 3'-phosphotransferase n=1 Tax=Paenibacillus sp. OV219 TaxID=1884377 RepID=UPI0008B6D883|nr:aminoglycoside 3'-phosphotransferase [Paenibacillus sp. OV219]SEO02118.1 kanamycin kinase [Paenibacillus sp. OV219]